MKFSNVTTTAAAGSVLVLVMLGGMLISSRPGKADNDNNGAQDEQLMISRGFAIAPVPLTMANKDHDLLGLGSYIVNAVADCNGCHNGDPSGSEFAAPNNPYLLMPPNGPFTGHAAVNPATYLAGGQFFGIFDAGGLSAPIISRNLTPDYRGLPEGGHTLSDFLLIIKTGVDMDKVHPTCTGALNNGCVPAPFNGALLQVMPWAIFRNMTDRQLQAIYTYLSAIPCIDNQTLPGPPSKPDELRNNCTGK
jgi:hypothetical protein